MRKVGISTPLTDELHLTILRSIYPSFVSTRRLDLDPGRAEEWREEEVQTPRFQEDVHN